MSDCDHNWFWMTHDFEPNDDGGTTTQYDYYKCRDCGQSKMETKQLDYVKRFARTGSNPIEAQQARRTGGGG